MLINTIGYKKIVIFKSEKKKWYGRDADHGRKRSINFTDMLFPSFSSVGKFLGKLKNSKNIILKLLGYQADVMDKGEEAMRNAYRISKTVLDNKNADDIQQGVNENAADAMSEDKAVITPDGPTHKPEVYKQPWFSDTLRRPMHQSHEYRVYEVILSTPEGMTTLFNDTIEE